MTIKDDNPNSPNNRNFYEIDPNNLVLLIEEKTPYIWWVIRKTLQSLHASPDQYKELGDDLFSYAVIGLIEAAQKFDPKRKISFETYAYYRVRGAVVQGLKTLNFEPPQFSQINDDSEGTLSSSRFYHRNEFLRSSDFEQRDSSDHHRSFDEVITQSALVDNPLIDTLNQIDRVDKIKVLDHALKRVTPLELKVLKYYFEDDLTLSEIASKLHYSTSWVSRRLQRALITLKEVIQREFKDFDPNL